MKYAIIISPIAKKSIAIKQAFNFIQALIEDSKHCNCSDIFVFFYGYAVKHAFEKDSIWTQLSDKGISLNACSTIADNYLTQGLNPNPAFALVGLGNWMNAVLDADRSIEFK